MRTILRAAAFCASAVAGLGAHAQDTVSAIEFAETQSGTPLSTIEITTETVAPGLHVLFGAGGNIAVSIGEQGVLIVDDQYPAIVPKIRDAIRALGGGDVDFVINTHWHFDHTNGNPLLTTTGSWVVSQANSRQMMLADRIINLVNVRVKQPASPPEGLPVITYDDRLVFHFNDQQIELLHFGPAHTTGDTAVVFRGSNAVHMGDIFSNWGYPFIDADSGGGLDGVVAFGEAILNEINESTIVIPGHGQVATYTDLEEYVSMLKAIRDRLAVLIADGATLDEVISAKPTAEWDAVEGDPTRLLNRAYRSMTR
jgi:glyoxylase-like metal-dependent hydrolase (beta-lactamase superfamily II)